MAILINDVVVVVVIYDGVVVNDDVADDDLDTILFNTQTTSIMWKSDSYVN